MKSFKVLTSSNHYLVNRSTLTRNFKKATVYSSLEAATKAIQDFKKSNVCHSISFNLVTVVNKSLTFC